MRYLFSRLLQFQRLDKGDISLEFSLHLLHGLDELTQGKHLL